MRLLAATPDGLAHATFADIGRYLRAGDLLVVNTSGTIAAAVDGSRGCGRADGQLVTVHFSTPLTSPRWMTRPGRWLVELRQNSAGRERVLDATEGETIDLPAGASLTLLYRYPESDSDRMWAASVETEVSTVDEYLARTVGRSGTPTSPTRGRWPPTRPCSPAILAARRCRAPGGRSPATWSPA